ncbi:MAG: MFS transporter [Rhodospirillaceae bacterium]|nr:MFS transporter [Rhodospirillaceae bacterium]
MPVANKGEPASALIADKQYRFVCAVGILLGTTRWLEFLAVGIFALDATGSAFLVALLALLRFFPLALFGVFLGALADMLDTTRLFAIAIALMGTVSLLLAGLFAIGQASYWHVAVATFLAGAFWASDMSLRRKLIGDIAGSERLGAAMAFDNAINNGTRLAGPIVAGVLYQWYGGGGVFLVAGILYLVALCFALNLRRSVAQDPPDSWILQPILNAWQAFRYAIADREVLAILGVTIAFNIWGFPMFSMVPVIGKLELGLSASTIGIVSAFQGAAGFIGALIVARLVKPTQYRAIYFYSVCGVISAVFLMGLFPGLAMLGFGVAAAGLAGAGFGSMQGTLIYRAAPAGMRGRLLGLVTICIGSGLIGFANVGVMADHFGASNALWIIALEGAIPMLVIGLTWRNLHR